MPKDQTQTLAGYPLVVGRHLDDQNESRSAANRETRGPRGDIVAFEDGCPGFALVKICLVSETCHMPMTLDQIVEETREMPGEVVAELIDRILVARHGGIEPSVAESWKTETDRRIAEIESGKVKGVTAEENAARIQKILRR